MASLPFGWAKKESRSRPGTFYYVNESTGQTSLRAPTIVEVLQRWQSKEAVAAREVEAFEEQLRVLESATVDLFRNGGKQTDENVVEMAMLQQQLTPLLEEAQTKLRRIRQHINMTCDHAGVSLPTTVRTLGGDGLSPSPLGEADTGTDIQHEVAAPRTQAVDGRHETSGEHQYLKAGMLAASTPRRTFARVIERSGGVFSSSSEGLVPLQQGDAVRDGVLCLAPFETVWGHSDLHLAMVFEHDATSSSCVVLFLHPIAQEMVPCPRLLTAPFECRSTRCLFSHGYCVASDQIKPCADPRDPAQCYVVPLRVGGGCLYRPRAPAAKESARIRDAGPSSSSLTRTPAVRLWQYGLILQLFDTGHVLVRPMFGGHAVKVARQDVTARPRLIESEDIESEDMHKAGQDMDTDCGQGEGCGLSSKPERQALVGDVHSAGAEGLDVTPSLRISAGGTRLLTATETPIMLAGQSDTDFGRWEEWSRGFASKMMEKQGYIKGQGLGRDKSGRVNPVPIVLLPPGKSLDYIMEKKEKGKDFKFAPKAKTQRQRQPKDNVFDFLNAMIGDSSAPQKTQGASADGKRQQGQCGNNGAGEPVRKKPISVQLIEVENQIAQLQKHIMEQKRVMSRQRGHEQLFAMTSSKVEMLEQQVTQLERTRVRLEKSRSSASSMKKLKIF
eukprot:m.173330 g.173330  ORF g.173330 m.173330 type:complete len:671 (+) comp14584_c0_seq5:104-2116(+)